MTKQVLTQARDFRLDQVESLSFRPRVVRLHGEQDLGLSVLVTYTFGDSTRNPGDIDVRVMDYFYHLHAGDEVELIAFHWHPGRKVQPDFPHLHVTSRPGPVRILRKNHVPTGLVSLEAVIRFTIQELGVRPPRPDWKQVLDTGQAAFAAQRT